MLSERAILLATRSVRSLALGALGIALPLALEANALGTARIACVLSAGLGGATLLVVLGPGAKVRNRLWALAAYSLLFGAAAVGVVAPASPLPPEAAAFLGAMSLQPNISPHAPLEHASLADGASDADRTKVFAWYNSLSTAALALGALAASAPASPAAEASVAGAAVLATAACYACAALAAAARLRRVEAAAGVAAPAPADDKRLADCTMRRRILSLAALFSFDSWAGGFVINALFAHWLSERYGGDGYAKTLGTLFFANQVIASFSFPVAAALSKRVGLINTMVFTHLPSNLCLVAIPFCTEYQVYGLVLVRGLLSQMDVPARESFMTGVVPRDERVACSRTIMIARAVACVLGPPCAAALWRARGPAAPLVFAGLAKSAYDLALLVVFRKVKPPEERRAAAAVSLPPTEKATLLKDVV